MVNSEKTKTILKTTVLTGAALALYHFPFSAFSRSVRKEVKRRSHGKCEDCGKNVKDGKSVAAHVDHNPENPNYNSPANGRHRCRACEAKIHLQYAFQPESLGMNTNDAAVTAWGLYVALTLPEKLKLPASLTPTIDKLRQMYQKDN